jgi:hypothetical protein
MEYGAPLIHCFYNINHSDKLYSKLHATQKQSLAWVLNTTTINFKVNEGILGVLPIFERFSHLRTMFQHHIESLHPQNPLAIFLNSSIVWQSHVLLQHLRHDSEFSEFRQTSQDQSSDSLRNYLLSRRMNYLSRQKGILINYISLNARNQSLVDRIITSPTIFQREFISWRLGKLFMRNKCICGEGWHRGHINHLPDISWRISPKLFRLWTEEKKTMSENYTIIDFLLNHQEWDICHMVLKDYRQSFEMMKENNKRKEDESEGMISIII